MTDNVEVFPGAFREYDDDRDWLVTDESGPRHSASVIPFTSRLERGGQCMRCGKKGHRAANCPMKSQPRSSSPICAND